MKLPATSIPLGSEASSFNMLKVLFPRELKWHGRLTDNDVREIQDRGGKFVILEPKYTDADLEVARKGCKQ